MAPQGFLGALPGPVPLPLPSDCAQLGALAPAAGAPKGPCGKRKGGCLGHHHPHRGLWPACWPARRRPRDQACWTQLARRSVVRVSETPRRELQTQSVGGGGRRAKKGENRAKAPPEPRDWVPRALCTGHSPHAAGTPPTGGVGAPAGEPTAPTRHPQEPGRARGVWAHLLAHEPLGSRRGRERRPSRQAPVDSAPTPPPPAQPPTCAVLSPGTRPEQECRFQTARKAPASEVLGDVDSSGRCSRPRLQRGPPCSCRDGAAPCSSPAPGRTR